MKHEKFVPASDPVAKPATTRLPSDERNSLSMTTRAQQLILDNRATAFAMLAEASRMEADLVVSKKEFGSGKVPGTAEMICLAEKAAYLLQDRRSRTRYLPDELLGEPGWDILLALFERNARDRSLSLLATWESSQAAPDDAKRWVERLTEKGLVEPGPEDGQGASPTVKLTERGLEAMFDLLASLDNPCSPQASAPRAIEPEQRYRAPSLEAFVIHHKDRRN